MHSLTPYRRLSRILLCSSLLGIGVPSVAGAQTPEQRAEASKHFKRGIALVDEAQYDQAIIEFQRAYELVPHYAVHFNVGQAFVAMQKPVQAVDAFGRYLSEGGDRIAVERRQAVESEIKHQTARIAYLTILVNVSGAEVRVDGERVGTSPLTTPVRVGVGTHRVVARLPGYPEQEQRVRVAGEQRKTVELEMAAGSVGGGRGEISINCPVPNVQVLLDGQLAGITPLLAPLETTAGAHTLLYRHADYGEGVQKLELRAGSSLSLTCNLQKSESSGASQADPRADASSSGFPRATLGWVLGAGGVVAGGVGLGLWLHNGGRISDYEAEDAAIREEAQRANQVTPELAARSQKNVELAESINAQEQLAGGLAIAGVAVVGVGATLILTDSSPKDAQVVASASSEGAFIGWRTAW